MNIALFWKVLVYLSGGVVAGLALFQLCHKEDIYELPLTRRQKIKYILWLLLGLATIIVNYLK